MNVDDGPILVTGAAGQLGSVGRTVAGLLLDRGFRVRAMVRREDERADGVQRVTGRPAMSVREFLSLNAEKFGGRRS